MPKIADIENTPNPNAKKFILKEPLTYGLVRSFENAEQAEIDPLAAALFGIPHVINVYYVDRWLTVTQDGTVDWDALLKQLAVPIRSAPAADAASVAASNTDANNLVSLSPADQLRLEQINALLDETIRPALGYDGGGLEIVDFSGNQLTVHYQGACGTCPTSLAGTLVAIENQLRTIEPDIEVVAV